MRHDGRAQATVGGIRESEKVALVAEEDLPARRDIAQHVRDAFALQRVRHRHQDPHILRRPKAGSSGPMGAR